MCEHETSTYLHLHCASLHGIEPFFQLFQLLCFHSFTCLDKLELWLNDLLQILQTREAAIDNKMNHVAYIQRIFKSTRKIRYANLFVANGLSCSQVPDYYTALSVVLIKTL